MSESLMNTEETVTRNLMAFHEAAIQSIKESERNLIENQRKMGPCYIEAGSLATLLPMVTENSVVNEVDDLTKVTFQIVC